jgi:hypothetical protein
MAAERIDWRDWDEFFRKRIDRPFRKPDTCDWYGNLPKSFAESLAIFQLGESGGGTIIEQARQSRIKAVDFHYADAMALFVAEEHRHADILASCVKALGGTLISRNWTAKLFVAARRLIGLRIKVLVLLAAEVVGICYYHLLASNIPQCDIKLMLDELVADELSHLQFHCCFLRSQARSGWRRGIFIMVWRATMLAAAIAVTIDHRNAMRDLGIGKKVVWRRWMDYGRLAEGFVTGRRRPADIPICE